MNEPTAFLWNHVETPLSDLDRVMLKHVRPGGNWQDIPSGLSRRVDQIRARSQARGLVHTTYYGRLRWEAPSYTISTYFTRSGNGCFIHPLHDRLLTAREAARLQTFPDSLHFHGSVRAVATQIGNAVPPLLGAAVADALPGTTVVDLFCGAGGLSAGLEMMSKRIQLGVDKDAAALKTFAVAHPSAKVRVANLADSDVLRAVCGDIRADGTPDILVGGPPCQSFSSAGRRLDDERSNLVFVFAEAVRLIKPPVFVIENVLGLRSHGAGLTLKALVGQLQNAGYFVSVWDLKAEEFGVPQRRRRLFVVGSAIEHLDPPRQLLPPYREGSLSHTTVRDACGDLAGVDPSSETIPAGELPEATTHLQRWLRGGNSVQEVLREVSKEAAPVDRELVLDLR